ncbi:MAG: 30S ribosomal protein S15 [Bacteroidales bacterium]|nr:30S ribosomal protein S15 [Bacteroidales bacterium]
MILTIEQKKEYFKSLGKNETDSGTSDVQVAIFTQRIKHLTEHLKRNKKDFATERALVNMVGRRKKLLSYIKHKDIERYRELIKKLEIRK